MFTFTSFTPCSSEIRSRTGATRWHGEHHSAQKSTITLPSAPSTSSSKVPTVASTAIPRPFSGLPHPTTPLRVALFPLRRLESHVPSASAAAGLERARARGARALGAGADVRGPARAEPRRPALLLH